MPKINKPSRSKLITLLDEAEFESLGIRFDRHQIQDEINHIMRSRMHDKSERLSELYETLQKMAARESALTVLILRLQSELNINW